MTEGVVNGNAGAVGPCDRECARESLTERKKQRTRQAIVAAAAVLFHERGYQATTVDEIAAAADVAPRTFYRYFAGKEDVIADIAGTRIMDITSALAARPADEPLPAALRAALLTTVTQGEGPNVRDVGLLRVESSLRGRLLEQMWQAQPLLSTVIGQRLNVPPESGQARLIASSVVAVLITAMEKWAEESGQRPLPSCVDELAELMFVGTNLCNQPAAPAQLGA